MSNSLDLRPATAAAPETQGSTAGVGGRFGSGRYHGIQVDVGSHGDLIKETDLGGLSASLFTPTPGRSPDTQGGGGSGAGVGRMSNSGIRVSNNGSFIPSPTRMSTLSTAAVIVSNTGEFAGASVRGVGEEEEDGDTRGSSGDRDEYEHQDAIKGSSAALVPLFPQQRMVQSARPVTRNGQEFLDASVWRDDIESQVGLIYTRLSCRHC